MLSTALSRSFFPVLGSNKFVSEEALGAVGPRRVAGGGAEAAVAAGGGHGEVKSPEAAAGGARNFPTASAGRSTSAGFGVIFWGVPNLGVPKGNCEFNTDPRFVGCKPNQFTCLEVF